MKKYIFLSFLFFAFSQTIQALEASVTYACFKTPKQPYVEVYLTILGNTLERMPVEDSLFQSTVQVVILFKQGENIVKFDKYILTGPSSKHALNLYDVKRFALPNGEYDLEVLVTDHLNTANFKAAQEVVNVNFTGPGLMQSDIELLASYHKEEMQNPAVKNGYYLEALPFNFYHKNLSQLIFYNEIYHSDEFIGDDFLIRYYIEKVNGNGKTETVIIGNKKRKPKPTNVILLQMDIAKLASGNYNLVVEVRNRNSELLSSRKLFFQRSNPYLDVELAKEAPLDEEFVATLTKEELRYSLKAIAPIVKDADVEVLNMIIANKDNLEPQRRFLFTFWVGRRPNEPQKAYEEYMEVARAVDRLYKSGFGYGFETDRGYIFMKYGKPDDILTVETDPSAPPYEMWLYEDYPATRQVRVKFLFYNTSLAGGDYKLLHSTARNELQNPQWELELYRDAPDEIEGNDYISGNRMQDGFNRNARRLFEDF